LFFSKFILTVGGYGSITHGTPRDGMYNMEKYHSLGYDPVMLAKLEEERRLQSGLHVDDKERDRQLMHQQVKNVKYFYSKTMQVVYMYLCKFHM